MPTTCVFYIDEAGNPDSFSIPLQLDHVETAVFCLFAVALPLTDWRDFDRAYVRLKLNFFKTEIDASHWVAPMWEIKGNELCAPRARDRRRKHAFLAEVFALCQRFEATTFGITFLKDHPVPMEPQPCYNMGFQYLAERFNTFLVESHAYDHGILIVDERVQKPNFSLASSYLSYIFGNETGRSLTRLIEGPLFANSRATAGLQITDNLAGAYFASDYYTHCRDIPGAPDYSHIPSRYWHKLRALEFKSKRPADGFIQHGYRLCDHRNYDHQPSLLAPGSCENDSI